MQNRKKLYLYPITKATFNQGGNTYIPNLKKFLTKYYDIVNTQTSIGLLDVILKMPKCNVIYFNWIEDVADRRFGFLQTLLLRFIIAFSKFRNIKIVWFIHNNLSHKRENLHLKKRITTLMENGADVILSHSGEARLSNKKKPISVFEHPVDPYKELPPTSVYEYDFLIWGTVNPYKGVAEFLKFNQNASVLKTYSVLIAGRFASQEYFETISKLDAANVTTINKTLSEDELQMYFAKCRYILFTNNATSVLSSAALCTTLTYGKTIIGPCIGSFKELGAKGLIYTYDSFENLEAMLPGLQAKESENDYHVKLQQYIEQHSWPAFVNFIKAAINEKKPLSI